MYKKTEETCLASQAVRRCEQGGLDQVGERAAHLDVVHGELRLIRERATRTEEVAVKWRNQQRGSLEDCWRI
jgi:hypothetical protein